MSASELAGPVRRDDHRRRRQRADPAELGDRHRELGQDLEEESLELVVGSVELIDQQHGLVPGADRGEERTLDQEVRSKQVLDVRLGVGGVHRADRDQLPRVIPLVERLRGIDPLVALQADQPPAQQLREDLRHLGLADPGLTFEQERLAEGQREVDRGRKPVVREVRMARERALKIVDVGEGEFRHARSVPSRVRFRAALRHRDRGHADAAFGDPRRDALAELPFDLPPA